MMDMLKGQNDPFLTISQFTENLDGVGQILEQNYPFLTTRSMKNRSSRLKKKFSNKLTHPEMDILIEADTDNNMVTEIPRTK